MSAAHEHDEDITVLFSALARPRPDGHDDPQVLTAADDMLRILGHTPDQHAA